MHSIIHKSYFRTLTSFNELFTKRSNKMIVLYRLQIYITIKHKCTFILFVKTKRKMVLNIFFSLKKLLIDYKDVFYDYKIIIYKRIFTTYSSTFVKNISKADVQFDITLLDCFIKTILQKIN